MDAHSVERKLAAILAADVAGYSRLIVGPRLRVRRWFLKRWIMVLLPRGFVFYARLSRSVSNIATQPQPLATLMCKSRRARIISLSTLSCLRCLAATPAQPTQPDKRRAEKR